MTGVRGAYTSSETNHNAFTYSLSSPHILFLLSNRLLPVFGTVDTGKGWDSQVYPHVMGGEGWGGEGWGGVGRGGEGRGGEGWGEEKREVRSPIKGHFAQSQ